MFAGARCQGAEGERADRRLGDLPVVSKAVVRQALGVRQAKRTCFMANHLHRYSDRALNVCEVQRVRGALANAFTRAAQRFQHPHRRCTTALLGEPLCKVLHCFAIA